MIPAGTATTTTTSEPFLPHNLNLAAGSGTVSSLTNNNKSAVGFADAADTVRRWCPNVPTDYTGAYGIDVAIYYSLTTAGSSATLQMTLDYGFVTVGALGTETQIVCNFVLTASSDVLTRVILGTIPHAAVNTAADLFSMQIGRNGTAGAGVDTFASTFYIHKIILEQRPAE